MTWHEIADPRRHETTLSSVLCKGYIFFSLTSLTSLQHCFSLHEYEYRIHVQNVGSDFSLLPQG